MQYIKSLEEWNTTAYTVVTLGKFDGVHRGHALLIDAMQHIASEQDLETVIFTFDVPPRPSAVQAADACAADAAGKTSDARAGDAKARAQGKQILTNAERRARFALCGVDHLVECPFTEELRVMTPEAFIREVLCGTLHVRAVVAGTDFRFGRDRAGDVETLKKAGEQLGFATRIMEKEIDDQSGREISSTFIREEIEAGRMENAARLLGRPYAVTGEVLHGKELGRTIGAPTINQTPPAEKLLPPDGVYFSETVIDGETYRGVTNIGLRPTVDGSARNAETHLLDADLDLYGRELAVSLLHFHRAEQKFDSLDALQAQIRADIGAARAYRA